MSKYKNEISKETIQQADKIAKANQRPGQSKEQTKLISQGIQKGIEQYKKQHKLKARELDKKLKSIKNKTSEPLTNISKTPKKNVPHQRQSSFNSLPWILLATSWIIFSVYIYITF